MRKMLWLILALIVGAILVNCGGGGGGSSNSEPTGPTPPTPRSHSVEFGYFGQQDGDEVVQADHVTFVFPMDWGSWDSQNQVNIQLRIINQLQTAKQRGIQKAVVAVGFLTWDQQGNLKGLDYLEVFKEQLNALGLMDMVVAFYPIDEPDLAIREGRMTTDNLKQGLINIHTVFPEVRMMVIYGDNGYPVIEGYDIVGHDRYGHGPQVPPINKNQTLVIVPGGADPWREDPQGYVDFAINDPRVEFVVAFLFVDFTAPDGKPARGIKNNGMLPAYKAAALKLREIK